MQMWCVSEKILLLSRQTETHTGDREGTVLLDYTHLIANKKKTSFWIIGLHPLDSKQKRKQVPPQENFILIETGQQYDL